VVIVIWSLDCFVVIAHRVPQAFCGLTAEELVLRSEICILGCPRSVHWIIWEFSRVCLLCDDLMRLRKLRLGVPWLQLEIRTRA
jgi:hypothetical protein